MHSTTRFLASLASLLLLSAAASAEPPPDSGATFAPREVLVRFAAAAPPDELRRVEARHGLELLDDIPHLRTRHYRITGGGGVEQVVEALYGEPSVELAEPNHLYVPQLVPSDPLFAEQWALHNTGQTVNGGAGPSDVDIDWPEAMDLFTGSSEVVVAVIDSGAALDHPDLHDNVWQNPGEGSLPDGVDDDLNGFVDDRFGWDFFDDDRIPLDENGHGSLVASVVGAVWNDGVGVSGVAPNAKLMALRILDDFGAGGAGGVANFVAASTYAAEMGARIVNFSAGHQGSSGTERAQIEWLDAQGVLLVAAAGNGGSDAQGDDNDVLPLYPASYTLPNIVSVAALGRSGGLSTFSNFGSSSVDLAAPGEDIRGADVTRTAVYLEDFESGAPGWTPGSSCPGACDAWGGFIDLFGNVWANDSDFMNEPLFYVPLVNSWITSPVLVLPALGPRLEFRIWHDLAPLFDVLAVELSTDGLSWDVLGLVMGTSATDPPGTSLDPGGFFAADLSAYAGAPALVRFGILSDAALQGDGVYIDDVSITRVDVFEFDGTQFRFDRGTSFSAPLVSGVAALMMSQQPALTHREVRELILSTVDPTAALGGMIASGGRLNARKALAAAIAAPEPTRPLLSITSVATTLLLARLGRGRVLKRVHAGFRS